MRFFISAISAVVVITALSASPLPAMNERGGGRGGDMDFRVGLRFSGERGFADGGFEGIALKSVRQESAAVLEEPRKEFFREESETLDSDAGSMGKQKEKKGMDWMILDPRLFTVAAFKEKFQTLPEKMAEHRPGGGKHGRKTGMNPNTGTLNARQRYFKQFEPVIPVVGARHAVPLQKNTVESFSSPIIKPIPTSTEVKLQPRISPDAVVAVVAPVPVDVQSSTVNDSWPPPAGQDLTATAPPVPANHEDDWVMMRTLCRIE